jgi:hypothetical protein
VLDRRKKEGRDPIPAFHLLQDLGEVCQHVADALRSARGQSVTMGQVQIIDGPPQGKRPEGPDQPCCLPARRRFNSPW